MTVESGNLAPDDIRRGLLARLGEFRRKIRGRLLIEGAARLLGAALLMALATFVMDRMFRLTLGARIGLVIAAGGGLAVITWREIVRPARLRLSDLTLAMALGEGVTARVASVLNLPSLLQGAAPPSQAMVRRAMRECHQALAGVNFGERLDGRRSRLAAAGAIGAVVLPLLLWLAAPGTVGLWAARMFAGSNRPWPQRTYLELSGLEGGMMVVPRGEPFVLRVAAQNGSVVPDGVTLRYQEGEAPRVRAGFTAFAANDFRYDFSGINAAVSAEVWGGDDFIGPFTIRPADRPRITDLKLIAQHPTESRPTTYTFSGADSDLSFLPLTHLRLLLAADTDIAEAHVGSSATRPSAGDLHRIDDRHFAIDWTHGRDVQLKIELISRDAHLASTPTEVAIGLKIDQPPRVTMAYSGVHLRVTPAARIPLTVEARDDFAVAGVALAIKLERPDAANAGALVAESQSVALYGPVVPASEAAVHLPYTMELAAMKLPAGSLVTVGAAATDACYTGPQTSRSRAVTFRVVPPEELFREILLRQQAERARFRKQEAEAEAIVGEIGLGDAAHRHRAVQREVNSVTATLEETVTEMRLNALATPEAYELLEKNVLTPLKTLNTDLMNPQKDALDLLKAEDARGLADARARQNQIVGRMQEILKQMSQWDSFVDVLNQLNEVIRVQEQAEQTTNQMKKQQTEGIFEK